MVEIDAENIGHRINCFRGDRKRGGSRRREGQIMEKIVAMYIFSSIS